MKYNFNLTIYTFWLSTDDSWPPDTIYEKKKNPCNMYQLVAYSETHNFNKDEQPKMF